MRSFCLTKRILIRRISVSPFLFHVFSFSFDGAREELCANCVQGTTSPVTIRGSIPKLQHGLAHADAPAQLQSSGPRDVSYVRHRALRLVRCLMNGRTTLPNLTPGRCISAPWISVNFNGASGLMWLSATDAFGTSIGGQDLRMRRSGWTSGFDSSRQTTGAVIRVELAQQITRGWGYSNGGCGLRDHHLPPSRRASASAN